MSDQLFNVLLIEDSREQWPIYRYALSKLSCKIAEANCASVAFELLSRTTFQLIIQDLGLPPDPIIGLAEGRSDLSNGEEVFTELRARTRCPIIVVSVYCDTLFGRPVIERLRPDFALPKPLVAAELEKFVRQQIELFQSKQALTQ